VARKSLGTTDLECKDRIVNHLKISKTNVFKPFVCLFQQKIEDRLNRHWQITYLIFILTLRCFSIYQLLTMERQSMKNQIYYSVSKWLSPEKTSMHHHPTFHLDIKINTHLPVFWVLQ
jgi:hypothetical protein